MKAVVDGWNKKYIKGTLFVQIQELCDNFSVVLCICTEFNGDIIMEVEKVDN